MASSSGVFARICCEVCGKKETRLSVVRVGLAYDDEDALHKLFLANGWTQDDADRTLCPMCSMRASGNPPVINIRYSPKWKNRQIIDTKYLKVMSHAGGEQYYDPACLHLNLSENEKLRNIFRCDDCGAHIFWDKEAQDAEAKRKKKGVGCSSCPECGGLGFEMDEDGFFLQNCPYCFGKGVEP